MAEIIFTQAEADALIAMEKHRVDETEHSFPDFGGAISVPLVSADKRERFLLDVSRGRINLAKVKYQNRAQQVVVLVRLELAGSPHRNPDGTEAPCPHLHLYREGFADKWAFPVPSDLFPDLADAWRALESFMQYCNVTQPPNIIKGLFT